MPTAVLGMRGTGNWEADARPKDWREAILWLYPNGSAPLTAILSKLKKERTYDVEYYWWTKTLPEQGGKITGRYTNATMTTAYVSGGVVNDVIYCKCALATANEFRPGHEVVLRDSDDPYVDVVGKVLSIDKNGANSYVAVRLLEADDNASATGHDISNADRILVIGNINPEGGEIPDAISYNPVKVYNRTQIWRNPLDITRTAMQTKYRTGDKYRELKREALEFHSIEQEKSMLWSIQTENVGSNEQNEGTTMGLVPCIKQYAPGNVSSFKLDANYAGEKWEDAGEDWFDARLETIYRYGSTSKTAFVGTGTLLGMKRLAKKGADITITPGIVEYGIRVLKYIHPQGELNMILHPLFSHEPSCRNSMVIFEPQKLVWRYIQDTIFVPDRNKSNKEGGRYRVDGIKEEFLTEGGLEYHHPSCFGYLNGFNQDNSAL